MHVLTIETTCDETAAAVVTGELEVLGAAVASQDELHERFRGVVPEIAARAHVERILPVVDHPHAGRYRVVPPMTGEPPDESTVRRPAPLPGEHNRDVLAELGYTDADIDALVAADVLYAG